MPIEATPVVRQHARRTASDRRNDQKAIIEIETRLGRGGFDQIDINAEVILHARALFAMFDQLTQSAQSRRIALLREVSVSREFARRQRRVIMAADGL
jgi:hypothetical protein